MKRHILQRLTLLLLFLLTACVSRQPSAFNLTVVHMNDTHSHLEPVAVNLLIDGVKTNARIGGFTHLKTLVDSMRDEAPDLLLLHGGDAVQGTIYFPLFNGSVEFDAMNLLGVDAMTFGNHEFDRGIAPLAGWISHSRFPWLSANIDFSGEPSVAPLVRPYLIKEIAGEQVAIMGVTTETTPQISLNTGRTVFHDPTASIRQQVVELTAMGVNKIVLLSHLGYESDKALASSVSGIDIIIGGHSHSLLGSDRQLALLGLKPAGPYPTEMTAPDGRRVLVAQAWQWGDLLGRLQVRFNPDGEIIGCNAGITMPVAGPFVQGGVPVSEGSEQDHRVRASLAASGIARIVPEDAGMTELLAPYARQVAAYRSVEVAVAVNDIIRGPNSGPGPLGADSMLAAVPQARVALLNHKGVRRDLLAGPITAGDTIEVMPFANTLVLVDLTGAELKAALEEGLEHLRRQDPESRPAATPYLAGARMTVQPAAPYGARVAALLVQDDRGGYHPIVDSEVYRIVVNSFIAGGGDGFTTIKNAGAFRSDTGIIDNDAFRDYLKKLDSVSNSTEQRIRILED